MKTLALAIIFLLLLPCSCLGGARPPAIFATFAADETQLSNTIVLTESLREFGGAYKDVPVRLYVPESLLKARDALWRRLAALDVDVRTSSAPAAMLEYEYARKVFAAAKAEAEASGAAPVLVWLDNDTVILSEPRELILPRGKSLAYRPVTQRNIGSLHSEDPGPFWSRVYRDLNVSPTAIFPMKTPADGETIRAYFNAGLLAVRPEREILKKWSEAFGVLRGDQAIVDMCAKDREEHLFLHQAALAGAILGTVGRNEMVELTAGYNYPLFFDRTNGASKSFDSLVGVVTLRYGTYFQNPAPGWEKQVKGPSERIEWLAARFGENKGTGENASTKMRFRLEHGGKKS